jgi:uncharacterized membrane protein
MNKTQKIILLTSAIFTIASWLYVLFNYSTLPNEIVGHMNFKGDVNRYDDKSTLWFLLTIFTAIQLLFFWSSQKKVSPTDNFKNTEVQKTVSLFTLIYISFILMGIIFVIIEKTQNPFFDTSWLLYAVVFTTLLYLIKLVSFIYKNLTS